MTTYEYNALNQLTAKEECGYIQSITRIQDYAYSYDKRGNLIKEEEICAPTTQGPRNITIGTYSYDETNRMVYGTNEAGEVSGYTYNGLGVRVGTELILEDNSHGYTDFHCQTPSVETGIETPEVVLTDYVIDYNRLGIDQRVLTKSETDGYDFRYVYGLDKLQVKVTGAGTDWWGQNVQQCVNLNYVHTDRLGSVVNQTDEFGRVTMRVDYNAWGEVKAYTDATVDQGYRVLLPEITFATHEYDEVLGQYYAKARMYDAEVKRFTAMDPVKGNVANPMTIVQYLYVLDNPLTLIDLLGLQYVIISGGKYGTGDGYNYEFIDTALLQIKILREVEKTTESILWLVADSGWTQTQKNDIKASATSWDNVKTQFFSKTQAIINLMNNGLTNDRKRDPISGVFIFSHGMPGAISFGYHQNNEADLLFTAEQIQKLNQGIFKSNAYFTLYTCRSGSTLNGATNFAQTLADWTGVSVKGTYSSNDSIYLPEFNPNERPTTEGRTDYGDILGLSKTKYNWYISQNQDPQIQAYYTDYYNKSKNLEEERDAVGGTAVPYPAFELPHPSFNPITEANPHWVTYTPSK